MLLSLDKSWTLFHSSTSGIRGIPNTEEKIGQNKNLAGNRGGFGYERGRGGASGGGQTKHPFLHLRPAKGPNPKARRGGNEL